MRRAAWLGLVAALLVLATGWWWSQGGDPAPPVGATAASTTKVVAVDRDASFVAERAVLAQDDAPTSSAVRVAPLPGTSQVAPYVVTAEVLDDADQPVEGAIVEVHAAACQHRSPTDDDRRDVVWLTARRDELLATAMTDASGHCAFRLEREIACVSASHERYGRSISRAIGRGELGSDHTVQLWLLRPVVVRGTVVDAHCAPVPYAFVDFTDQGPMGKLGKFGPTGWIAVDRDGKFQFEVAAGSWGSVSARIGSSTSPRVRFTADADLDLLVAFAGTFRIRGCVRDAAGRPVRAARVVAMADGRSQELVNSMTDQRGLFELPCTTLGSFTVTASIDQPVALVSKMTKVDVSVQDQDPYVDLALEPPGSIEGQVLTSDGRPAAGLELHVAIGASPMPLLKLVTRADGTFSKALPISLMVTISGPLLVPVTVASDVRGLVLVQQPPPPQMVVTGEVFTTDGRPAPQPTLCWRHTRIEGEHAMESEEPVNATIDGSRFRLQSPVRGPDWFLLAVGGEADGYAAIAGPFVDAGERHVVMQMQQPATVTLRVLVDHQPAAGIRVALVHALSSGTKAESVPWHTDRDGCVLVTDRWPGRTSVVIGRGYERLAVREVDLRSGENGELVIDIER